MQVWEQNFGSSLTIRESSSHKTCNECIKHKCIIRKLTGNRAAMAAQQAIWSRHLDRQYADRVCYWNARASSRLGFDESGGPTICCIIDSMDRSKWAIPRAAALCTKELGAMARPNLDMTLIIAHGQLCGAFFADPRVQKGSNWTVDIILHTLHVLASQGLDLRNYSFILQSDNASKEAKSNAVLRLMALLVSRKRLRQAHLRCLVSGHSHEDVDQTFSLMASFLERKTELHNDRHFAEAMEEFWGNPSVRPSEPHRFVHRVSQVRDWRLSRH